MFAPMNKGTAPTLSSVTGRDFPCKQRVELFSDQLNSKTSTWAQRMRSSIVRG